MSESLIVEPLAALATVRNDADTNLTTSIKALSAVVMLDFDLQTALTRIAYSALEAIPGADTAGLTLFHGDRRQTVVVGAAVADHTGAEQDAMGEGPHVTAAAERRTVRSNSLGCDEVFPMFDAHVAELGLHSWLSLPLFDGDAVVACITVYAVAEDAFDDRAAELGERFAGPAGIQVRNAQTLAQAQRSAAALHASLTRAAALSPGIASEPDSGERPEFPTVPPCNHRPASPCELAADPSDHATSQRWRDRPTVAVAGLLKGLAAALSAWAILGWALRSAHLTRVFPESEAIRFNGAIPLFLLAAAWFCRGALPSARQWLRAWSDWLRSPSMRSARTSVSII